MSSPDIDENTRARILSNPDAVLEDREVMRALIAANERAMGTNIVDLRAIAMERLEARLARLEDTHRAVIAAAYENLSGTNIIHEAVLRLLEANDFGAFLNILGEDLGRIMRVDAVRLVLETRKPAEAEALARLGAVLGTAGPGFVARYQQGGRSGPARAVTLRQVGTGSEEVFGEAARWVRSEALLRLDLGQGRLPGLLALGSEDPHHFSPQQGTDLLAFFGGVFERLMRRWLG